MSSRGRIENQAPQAKESNKQLIMSQLRQNPTDVANQTQKEPTVAANQEAKKQ